MLKGRYYKDTVWSTIVDIISITPLRKTNTMHSFIDSDVLYYVIYINEFNELDTFITNSLTDIKII
jgi:hypothetical protein